MSLTSIYIVPVLLSVLVILFFSPGLLAGIWLTKTQRMSPLYVLPVAGLTGCLIGLTGFWIWLASPPIGRWFSLLVVIGEVIAAGWLMASKPVRLTLLRIDAVAPLIILVFVTLFYNGVIFSCLGGPVEFCHVDRSDNMLPQLFANNVAAGQPRLMFAGGWQGSDRPPLQAGIVLAQEALTRGRPFAALGYQLLSSALQCMWIIALWVAARKLRLPVRRIVLLITLCVFCGFFFYNSFFVWPKLLAAALGLVAFCMLVAEQRRTLYWGLAAAFLACAMLAHSGVIFTIVPIAAIILLSRFRPSLKTLAVAAFVGAIVLAPWLAYQNFYDPPGNRLQKWHLAGVIPVDDRSVGQALRDSYSTTPLSTLVTNRLDNLRTVVGAIDNDANRYGPDSFYVTLSGPSNLDKLRDMEYRCTLFGIGLLNIGWLSLLFPSVRRRLRATGLDIAFLRLLIGVGLSSLLLWALALFPPYSAIIHQGSYLTMMMLMASFGTLVTVLPKRIVLPLMILQFAYFVVAWILSVFASHVLYSRGLIWMVAGLLGIVSSLLLISGHRDDGPSDPVPGPTLRTASVSKVVNIA